MGSRRVLSTLVVVFMFSVACVSGSGGGFGDRLLRTFLKFAVEPLNMQEATQAGWSPVSKVCDPEHGFSFSQGGVSGPTTAHPYMMYFTKAGQVAGFGIRVWSQPTQSLVPDFWRPSPDDKGAWDLIVSTRNSSMMCSGQNDTQNGPLGDIVTIGRTLPVHMTLEEAEEAGWVGGNCIKGMGIHYSYDLAARGNLTWNINSFVPVQPMYNVASHALDAVLLMVPWATLTEPFGNFEGPFTDSLYCKNFCENTGCHFPGVAFFSTMHWMFSDTSLNTCEGAPCIL